MIGNQLRAAERAPGEAIFSASASIPYKATSTKPTKAGIDALGHRASTRIGHQLMTAAFTHNSAAITRGSILRSSHQRFSSPVA